MIILDGAHNGASARVLAETVSEVLPGRNIILVLGMCADKEQDSILKEFRTITENIIFTKADHPRAADLDGSVSVEEAMDEACSQAGDEDVILVAGSIFVVSEARRYLQACKTASTS